MSLLGNRGRFTKDKKESFDYSNAEFESVLSLIGKNPVKLFNILTEKEKEHEIKDRIKNSNIDNYEPEVFNSHQEYNKKVNKYNNILNKKHSLSNKDSENSFIKKRKTNIKLLIAMFFIEIFTLVGIYFVGSVYRYSNLTQAIPFNVKNVENTDIAESTLAIMKGYKTAAIFGVDSRTGSVDKGNNADVNMIVNLNLETGDAQLISVYRDLFLSVTDNNTYDKLNAAYRRGGPEQAVKTLNSKGGTVFIDTPVINLSSKCVLTLSGTEAGGIVGKKQSNDQYPRLDFKKARTEGSNNPGIKINGSKKFVKYLIIENAKNKGIWITGNSNLIDHVISR